MIMHNATNMKIGGGGYTEPYASLSLEDESVHYNIFKAKLTLDNKKTITIPQNGNNTDSALTISETAEYKADIVDVVVGNRVKTLGGGVFSGCTKLENIDLPSGLTSINNYVFSGCTNLQSITIPSGVTSIGTNVFAFCGSLTEIEFPNKLVSIGVQALYGCSGLTSITFNDALLTISNSAFRNCKGLTSIELPSSITSIEICAFYTCTNLSSVTILATTPPTLGVLVFNGNASGRKIYVPSESVEVYKAATNWSTYANDILPIEQ